MTLLTIKIWLSGFLLLILATFIAQVVDRESWVKPLVVVAVAYAFSGALALIWLLP